MFTPCVDQTIFRLQEVGSHDAGRQVCVPVLEGFDDRRVVEGDPEALGCRGIRVEQPDALAAALREGLGAQGPTIIDLVVTRDPAKMLPAADSRAVQMKKGDRVA